MSAMHEFYMGTRVVYGRGAVEKLGQILADNGWRSAGVVVDHNLAAHERIKKILADLKKSCAKTAVELCTISEPTYDFLDGIKDNFRDKGLDVVIGIGGGSALDTAKAMAVLANNKSSPITYRGFNKMTEPVLPVIAIPTTAGTGSEVTPNASFIDTKEKRKMGINGEAIRPRYAILDPELTLSCPVKPTISAGVDSMVHAVEAYAAKKTNPMARMFAREGFGLVFRNLPLAVKDPANIDHREKVMHGAFLSGIALMNSGTGPAAAMSYPLGVHFKVPHGIGGGLFLPYVADHNVKNGYYDYAGLYDAISGEPADNAASREKAGLFVKKLFSLWKELSIPDDLSAFGLKPESVPQFIADTMSLKGALDQNPVPFYEAEIEAVLGKLI